MVKKSEGFEGQRAIVIARSFRDVMHSDEICRSVYVTDIGYYPAASDHYRTRPDGSKQNILIHCISGSGWVEIAGERLKVLTGQFIIIEAGTAHTYGATPGDPWTINWLHFTGENAAIFREIYNKPIEVNDTYSSVNKERSKLFEEIYRNLEMGYSIENLRFCSISLWYLLGSLRYMAQYREVDNPVKEDIVQSSIRYMKENVAEKLTLEMIADNVAYSPSHFSAVFTKKTGLTPLNYFTNLKVQQACQYLDFTQLKIKEIAVKLGFYDQYYFSKVFHKNMGYTPTDYRERKKGFNSIP